MAFESGLVCAFDAKNSFSFIGIIEKDAQRFAYQNTLDMQVKLLESTTKTEAKPLGTEYNFNMNASFDSLDPKFSGRSYTN